MGLVIKRNNKAEKEKNLLRVKRTLDKIRYPKQGVYDDLYDWVPVEKPRFLGYDTVLYYSELNENIKGVKLAKYLLNKYKPHNLFITNKIVKSLVNKAKGSYSEYKKIVVDMARKGKLGRYRANKYSFYTNNDIINLFIPTLRLVYSEHTFNSFPEEDKVYFDVSRKTTNTGYSYYYYTLDIGRLMLPYLKIGLVPAYSTHIGIPKSDKISEEKFLEDKLYQELFYEKHWGKNSWRRHEEKETIKKSRYNSKLQLKRIINKEKEEDTYEDISFK